MMGLGLLLPLGLLALAALAIPFLLHLDRQTEPRQIPFAALRWLLARQQPRRRFRLIELWLLLLRLLLVASVAMLFAQPVLFGVGVDEPRVLVAPGVDLAAARAAVPGKSARWQWLAPGLPDTDSTPRPPASQPIASLLREADAGLPAKTPMTVLVPAVIAGLDAERPRLGRRVEWKVLPGVDALRPRLTAVPPTLFIRHAVDSAEPARYLRAAATAWGGATPAAGPSSATLANPIAVDLGPITQAVPADARWLAWLAPGQPPAAVKRWVDAGGVLLTVGAAKADEANAAVVWRDNTGAVLATAANQGRGRVVQLLQPLLPARLPALLEGDFPQRLRSLFAGPNLPPEQASADALKPLPGGSAYPEIPRPLLPWLAWLAAILFVMERLLATAASRGLRR